MWSNLGNMIDRVIEAEATSTHRLLDRLVELGRLQRCYSLNIDGLELHSGVLTCWPDESTDGAHAKEQTIHCVLMHGCSRMLVCNCGDVKRVGDGELADMKAGKDLYHRHKQGNALVKCKGPPI